MSFIIRSCAMKYSTDGIEIFSVALSPQQHSTIEEINTKKCLARFSFIKYSFAGILNKKNFTKSGFFSAVAF